MSRAGRKILRSASRFGALTALGLVVGGVGSASAGTLSVRLGVDPTGCVAQGWFAAGMAGSALCIDRGGGWDINSASQTVSAGATGYWQINAPAGITIETAAIPSIQSSGLVSNGSNGWQAADYWAGYSNPGHVWGPGTTSINPEGATTPLNSPFYGFKLYCYASSCSNNGSVFVYEVDISATENQGPALTAVGSNNLWYQGGHYVWNPPGDPWSIELSASDPSGVCNTYAEVNTNTLPGPSATPVNDTFQQCPSPVDWSPSNGASVDVNQYVPAGTSGTFSLQFDATNAAGVLSNPSETIQGDNIQPSVSLSASNDANPSVWVGHAVTVTAAAHAGPSGVGSVSCSGDGAPAKPYPSGGVTVDGTGTHQVACTVTNRAVDPQGNPNSGTGSIAVKIDETPPSVQFEPANPTDPTALVADTSDSESGVAGGSITISGPGLNSPMTLPTSFDGSHLISRFDDAGLRGVYTFTATSCDVVGNCASTNQSLSLPVRLAAISHVSFVKIQSPAKIVRKRVLVDYHYRVERLHGRRIRVKVGGHYRRIRIVIPVNTSCGQRRVKLARHRWREITVCRILKLKLKTKRSVRFGRKTSVHGLLMTSQGAPIAGVPVAIETAPDNGTGQFTRAAVATTSSTGAWSATLPAGPSRIIHAVYSGSATILPAAGVATVAVPAKIRITSITPLNPPWNSWITITGELSGGYLPPGGALVELHYSYGRAQTVYGVKTHVTTSRFTTRFKFGPGQTPLTFGFQLSTLPASGYAFSPGWSNT
ncbi:MAG: hypothetical protein ACYDHH_34645, partial [Solirubrobacteraceae bacterium]